eukprot:3792724-Karenia_brevis.AAC.1
MDGSFRVPVESGPPQRPLESLVPTLRDPPVDVCCDCVPAPDTDLPPLTDCCVGSTEGEVKMSQDDCGLHKNELAEKHE